VTTALLHERTRWRNITLALLGMLVLANVMSNRVLPNWAYLPWNVCVAVAIVLVAVRLVDRETLGLGAWRHGAAWGGVLAVLTAGALLLGLTMPVFDEMYRDRRVTGDTVDWLYHAFVRIPLGTVLLEEIAFRGVLPGVFGVRWGVLRASVAASVCFGVWHVLPALGLNSVNPVASRVFGDGLGGVAAAVVFAVVGTGLTGLWWCWIRYRSGSVLATMIAHVASNSIAYTIAFAVTS